jgi:hypothetical protein
MIKCPSCGEENPPGVGLCKHCGGPISLKEDVQPEVAPGSFEEQILGLLRAGKKMDAIKLHRIKTGSGLKEAKDAASGAGCAGMLLIAVAAVFVLLKYAGVA